MENLLLTHKQDLQNNEFITTAKNGKISMISTINIADVIVEIIQQNKWKNEIINLTGQEQISYGKTIDIINNNLNRTIKFSNVSKKEYIKHLYSLSFKEDIIKSLVSLNNYCKWGLMKKVYPDLKNYISDEKIITLEKFVNLNKDII